VTSLLLHSVELDQELGHNLLRERVADPSLAYGGDRLHLINKEDRRRATSRPLKQGLNELPRLTHVSRL
jgi:hypothetical protein